MVKSSYAIHNCLVGFNRRDMDEMLRIIGFHYLAVIHFTLSHIIEIWTIACRDNYSFRGSSFYSVEDDVFLENIVVFECLLSRMENVDVS